MLEDGDVSTITFDGAGFVAFALYADEFVSIGPDVGGFFSARLDIRFDDGELLGSMVDDGGFDHISFYDGKFFVHSFVNGRLLYSALYLGKFLCVQLDDGAFFATMFDDGEFITVMFDDGIFFYFSSAREDKKRTGFRGSSPIGDHNAAADSG